MFRVETILRIAWKDAESDSSVMFYFQLVAEHMSAMLPFVYLVTVYPKFEEIKRMLETISHNSLLKQIDKFGKMVCVVHKSSSSIFSILKQIMETVHFFRSG